MAVLKQTVNTWCTNTYECQDFNGLVCLNIGGKKACECPNKRYWNGFQCVNKLSNGESCSLDAECDHKVGLACYGECRCDGSRYWSGTSCELKKNHGDECSQTFQCKNNLGLFCLSGDCECMPLMFWSGTICELFDRSCKV
ncbi:hypothetical protein BpHYR1_002416 [Brachionus plicatilis]|uniref:EGF-like domain-containing protein n=1 Tax=Brachionus plicatilis TaxID=10195 RepID=A0A3M7P619_BRAPC|nr:hypothetical protein BpHYR1_002416 [Brachionus plicatilis]